MQIYTSLRLNNPVYVLGKTSIKPFGTYLLVPAITERSSHCLLESCPVYNIHFFPIILSCSQRTVKVAGKLMYIPCYFFLHMRKDRNWLWCVLCSIIPDEVISLCYELESVFPQDSMVQGVLQLQHSSETHPPEHASPLRKTYLSVSNCLSQSLLSGQVENSLYSSCTVYVSLTKLYLPL